MPTTSDPIQLDEADRAVLGAAKARMDEKMARLRDVVPCIIDMSGREATLAAAHGHTLDDKKALYRLARDFGFTDFGLPSFFDFPSVSDQFLDFLIEEGIDLDSFFTTLAVEPPVDGHAVAPNRTVEAIERAGIANLILMIEIRPATLATIGRSADEAMGDLDRYVRHFRARLPAESARTGRIHVRVADPFDAFDEDPESVMRAFKRLGALPISGILFEDVRGTRFTFESNEIIRLARHYNPVPRKILVHPHSGNGLEDAATIEAILAGADGLWSGFTPQAAQGAHGSVMMFLANLLRAGNPHVREMYRIGTLTETAEAMWQIHDRGPIPPTQPVVGARAYRYVDQYFEQTDLPRDLDPTLIGRKPGYEITPAWAPNYVIGKRLEELGYGDEVAGNDALHRMMRILMNRAQTEGKHIRFDDPDELAKLVAWAEEEQRTTNLDLGSAPATNVLASRYR